MSLVITCIIISIIVVVIITGVFPVACWEVIVAGIYFIYLFIFIFCFSINYYLYYSFDIRSD